MSDTGEQQDTQKWERWGWIGSGELNGIRVAYGKDELGRPKYRDVSTAEIVQMQHEYLALRSQLATVNQELVEAVALRDKWINYAFVGEFMPPLPNGRAKELPTAIETLTEQLATVTREREAWHGKFHAMSTLLGAPSALTERVLRQEHPDIAQLVDTFRNAAEQQLATLQAENARLTEIERLRGEMAALIGKDKDFIAAWTKANEKMLTKLADTSRCYGEVMEDLGLSPDAQPEEASAQLATLKKANAQLEAALEVVESYMPIGTPNKRGEFVILESSVKHIRKELDAARVLAGKE